MARGHRQGWWLWKAFLAGALSVALGVPGVGLCTVKGPISRGTATGNSVALTFDDGPSPRFTPKILKLLKEYGARATFFVLGEHAARHPRLIKKLVQAGQEVENHSYHHLRFSEEDKSVWAQEIESTEVELDLLGSPDHKLFRPPYSDYNQSLLKFLDHLHQRLVLWSVDSRDWQEPDPYNIAVNVLTQVAPGAIVIFHDSDETGQADRQPTVEALGLILPALKARGLKCVNVSELLAPSPPQVLNKLPGNRANCPGEADKIEYNSAKEGLKVTRGR